MTVVIIESRPITADWNPSHDGMVRCCDCLNYQRLEDGGPLRCRLAWRPAMVAGKWRRCKSYDRRIGGGLPKPRA